MFSRLWLYQKPLEFNSRWFKLKKRIRCRSKSNLTNQEFVGQLIKVNANYNVTDAAGVDESVFVLKKLKKPNKTRLKFSQENVKVLQIIANYQVVTLN